MSTWSREPKVTLSDSSSLTAAVTLPTVTEQLRPTAGGDPLPKASQTSARRTF